jgi:MFS family permease
MDQALPRLNDNDETLPLARRLNLLIFFQMLPATLLSPAIRPLFARYHANNESAMHAFMAVNMCAAVLVVPWLARRAERLHDTRSLMARLVAVDSLLLALLALPLPIPALLSVRALEGIAHVGVTSMLLAEMSRLTNDGRRAKLMGQAGASLMFAVALGSTLGGFCVAFDPRLPFWLGSAVQLAVALALAQPTDAFRTEAAARPEAPARLLDEASRALIVPMLAVFVGRFTVGCIVVTFALFAHRAHDMSDRSIGLLFSLTTLPFAAAMYPASRLAERVPRSAVLATGAVLLACALLALGHVPTAWLPADMMLLGVASALLFAPTLCYAGARSDAGRHRRMAALNAAGCLGMVIGPMAAGITSAIVGTVDPIAGYRAVFALAGATVLFWLLASLPWLVVQGRVEHAALRATVSAR